VLWATVLAVVFVLGASAFLFPPNGGGGGGRGGAGASVSTLKLLQFNVLQGATGGRAAGVVAVIKDSGADVVTLDEVNVPKIFDQIAAATQLHSYYVQSRDGYNVGILSRFRLGICTSYIQPPLHHGAFGCPIQIAGTTWWIFGAHLCPCSNENERVQEATFLLSQMKPHTQNAETPVVLSGDLNSRAPPETSPKPLLVIPLLESSGYVDSFRELHTAQQDPGFTVSSPTYGGYWHHRVDYVFHSADVHATAARVISSVAGYTWPSDHAALYVTLVNGAKPTS
jgi:exonuclease III